MKKISVIIPTLQKNKTILDMLLNELNADNSVSEIILIDSSRKGYNTELSKVRVIIPEENINLYVNQSWNLGVKEAKENLFALFNDDLLVCDNFCSRVIELIEAINNFGFLGMSENSIINTNITNYPQYTNFYIKEISKRRPSFWGSIIFGNKQNYKEIPENIKVWCGDDYIIYSCDKNVYELEKAQIFHLGSLSSHNKALKKIKHSDVFNFAELYPKYKETKTFKDIQSKYTFAGRLKNIMDNIFSFKLTYDEKYYILRILYIRIKIKKSKH